MRCSDEQEARLQAGVQVPGREAAMKENVLSTMGVYQSDLPIKTFLGFNIGTSGARGKHSGLRKALGSEPAAQDGEVGASLA